MMKIQKTKQYPPTNIRAALLAFASLVRATGPDGAAWAEHFLRELPAVPYPKMGDIFIAATRGLPQATPDPRPGYGCTRPFDLSFEFRLGVDWTLRFDNLSVTHSCPYPGDPGQLWIAEWVEPCDPVESPDWVFTLYPEGGQERVHEDLTGFHFAADDWSGVVFSMCTFDTYFPPRNLLDGGASFAECRGPDGEEWAR